MDCVNHAGKPATAYCQSCGKPLCNDCIAPGAMYPGARGVILCSQCIGAWQNSNPFASSAGAPSPSVAAALGLIPGVGAMYNGQFVKGLIHVVIFAVLVSAANVYGIFGLFIAAWIFYQSFEAYHTAKARRDGSPLPDPLGLNDLGNRFTTGSQQAGAGWQQPGAAPTQGPVNPTENPADPASPDPASFNPGPAQTGAQGSYAPPPYQSPYQAPYQAPFGASWTPPPTGNAGQVVPPVPPPPPNCWNRREPIGAIVLIVLGVLFALGQMNIFSDRVFEYSWPVLLIALGLWLMVRRIGDIKGGK